MQKSVNDSWVVVEGVGIRLTVHVALSKTKPDMFSSSSDVEDGGVDDTPAEDQDGAYQRLVCQTTKLAGFCGSR